MTTGVKLPEIDFPAREAEMAAEQRELFKLAMQKEGRRPDGAAAIKLLYYFSREMIIDVDVQAAIMDGAREVAAYVANETLLRQDGQPANVRPLMFFHGVDFDYTETRKNKKNERVALAVAFNDENLPGRSRGAPLMLSEEAEYALTRKWTVKDVKGQRFGSKKQRETWPKLRDRKDWPTTVEAVERMLMKYAETKHGLTDRAKCQDFVRTSFAANAWHDDARKPVVYPRGWGS